MLIPFLLVFSFVGHRELVASDAADLVWRIDRLKSGLQWGENEGALGTLEKRVEKPEDFEGFSERLRAPNGTVETQCGSRNAECGIIEV